MLPLQSLFGKSPFMYLMRHMESVRSCVLILPSLVHAFQTNDFSEVELLSKAISDQEYRADTIMNDIRNSVSHSLFLAVNKRDFLEILDAQDDIADAIEKVAMTMSLRHLQFFDDMNPAFSRFVSINIESFEIVYDIVRELPGLNEVSFSGIEAVKVKLMADSIAKKEHQAATIHRDLMKILFFHDTVLTSGMFYQWKTILKNIGTLSQASEKLGFTIRNTVDGTS